MKYLQTSPAGDVDNGAGEAGDVFSHTVVRHICLCVQQDGEYRLRFFNI